MNVGESSPRPWPLSSALTLVSILIVSMAEISTRSKIKVSVDRLNSDVMWMDVMSRSGHVWSPEKKHTTPRVFHATIRCTTLDWEMLVSMLNNVVTTLQSASVTRT